MDCPDEEAVRGHHLERQESVKKAKEVWQQPTAKKSQRARSGIFYPMRQKHTANFLSRRTDAITLQYQN